MVSETMQQQAEEDGGEGEAADVGFCADESLGPGEPEWANYVKGVVKEFMAKVDFTSTLVGVDYSRKHGRELLRRSFVGEEKNNPTGT